MEKIVLKKEVAVVCFVCNRTSSIYDDLKKDDFVIYEKKEEDIKRKEEALNNHISRLINGICLSSQSLKGFFKDLIRKHELFVYIEWEDKDFDDMLNNNPLFKKLYKTNNIYVFRYELLPPQSILLPLLLSFGLDTDCLSEVSNVFGLDVYNKNNCKSKRKG